jgi:NAD(P)-dependent dehydrogenase (short-subunit alcohol dehydrogenase family)
MTAKKTFFITGTNSGFGRAIALAAAQADHSVIGAVRSEAAVAEIEAAGRGRIHGLVLDVTSSQAIPSVVAEAEAKFGPVDVLINNAGYGHEGILEESPLEEMRRQFEVNVFGAVAVAKAFLPRFRERRRGFIVNVTSMGGLITMPGIGLLLRQQIRSSGHLRSDARGDGAVRGACDRALPRLVPHRLGRTLHGAQRSDNRRL